MRADGLATFVMGLLMLTGLCAAQDTNFPVGPQYLMNYGSPLFFRSIETPSLSLSAPSATNPSAPAEQGTGEPSSPAEGGLNGQAAINRIYWGASPAGRPLDEMTVGESMTAEASTVGKSSEIELSSAAPSGPIPSSLADFGVSAMADTQGNYSVPLGDTAAYWKTNKSRVARVFTNADVAPTHTN